MIKVFQYHPTILPSIEFFSQENWMRPNKLMRFIRDEKPFSLQSKLIKNSNLKIFMIWIEWENVWLTSWQWSSVDRDRILMSVVLSCSLLSNRFTNVVNESLIARGVISVFVSVGNLNHCVILLWLPGFCLASLKIFLKRTFWIHLRKKRFNKLWGILWWF